MKKQYVIAECIDHRDGQRYFPGAVFPNPTALQVERLTASRCLSETKPDGLGSDEGGSGDAGAGARANVGAAAADDLDSIRNTMSLKKVAAVELVDLGTAKTAAEIREAIRAARAAKAAQANA